MNKKAENMHDTNRIPFLDLVAPHKELREELAGVFNSVLDTAGFIGGPVVKRFEADFAEFCGTAYSVGVSSGTDALRFALMAAGVGEGGVVVTVPNTFIATAEAISQSGAQPVFVDVDERTYNMDPRRLEEYLERSCYRDATTGSLVDRKLGKRVAAIVPVHLFGQPANMDAILDLAGRYQVLVIEDACQAHGAEYFSQEGGWRQAGSMGRAAAFSFYPGKNLGACGEGGAVTTNDAEMAQKIRMLRDHGQAEKYYHEIEGYNGRLDAVQAGILQIKLKHLTAWNEQRRQHARYYRELLGSVEGVVLPEEPTWTKSVYHLYVIRVPERDHLQNDLNEAGIGTGVHYPVPLHLQRAYKGLGYSAGDFPVSERCAAEIVSLPMFPNLSAEQQNRVTKAVQASVRRSNCGLARMVATAGD
jgi:dTDP-4-amino-4,6-dideoxygalactose transaminase